MYGTVSTTTPHHSHYADYQDILNNAVSQFTQSQAKLKQSQARITKIETKDQAEQTELDLLVPYLDGYVNRWSGAGAPVEL